MERAGEILGPALRRLGKPESALAWLKAMWPSLVGEKLAAHTRPLHFAGGTLDVCADTADWHNEIEGMAEGFRSKINRAWGRSLVHELRFKRAPRTGPRVPKELDNEHTPFVRAGRGAGPRNRR
jgi:predicted nucleic acid-binding Zn ribbon protein